MSVPRLLLLPLAFLFCAALEAQAPAPDLLTHAYGAPSTTANAASTSLGLNASSGVTRCTSDDGRYVLVNSSASNLVAGQSDANGAADLFIYDRVSDVYTLVSHTPGSTTQTGNGLSGFASISADGAWVAFSSAATDLVSGITDSNGQQDVFLFETATGIISLASKSGSNPNVTANGRTIGSQISYDGRYVASYTLATDFAPGITDTNGCNDIVLYDRVTDTNRVVSHTASSSTTTFTPAGSQPDAFRVNMALSSYYLVYICGGTDLVAGQTDTNTFGDLFCYDIATDTNTLITHTFGSNTTSASPACYSGAISGDGNYVLFHHNAGNLVNGTDTNSNFDLFLWSRASNSSVLVSHVAGQPTTASTSITVSGPPPLPATYNGVISDDGRYCAYFHGANDLVAGQSGTTNNLFLYDRVTGDNTLVTHQPGSTTVGVGGMATMGGTLDAAISADGDQLAYVATATNLVTGVTDSNGVSDVFLFTRSSGANILLSRTLASATTAANGTSQRLSLSRNEALVQFQSGATDMAGTDANGVNDIFGVSLGAVLGAAAPDTSGTSGGVSVVLTGVGLTGVSAVRFGGVNATSFGVISDTQINATAPAHAAGAVTIELDTTFTTTSFSGLFSYVTSPTLGSVSPNTGSVSGGTSVTLSGSDLTGATSVTFGGTAATSVVVVSDTQITCTTPAHAQGAVSVIVTTPAGSNAANTLFTYVANAPTVTGVNPTSGTTAGGTSVTITGSNFVAVSGVTFGGVAATSVITVNSTTITCVTPAHAQGTVSVEVTTASGTNAANSLFTYFVPAAPQEVDITRAGVGITAGGTDTLNGAQAGTGITLTYTISNLGGTDLTVVSPVNASGATNCSAMVTQQPATLVTAGNTTTLTITVTPTASGLFSVDISVASNDSDENPYTWTITGVAAANGGGGGNGSGGGSGGGGGCAAGGGGASLFLVPLVLTLVGLARRRRLSR